MFPLPPQTVSLPVLLPMANSQNAVKTEIGHIKGTKLVR